MGPAWNSKVSSSWAQGKAGSGFMQVLKVRLVGPLQAGFESLSLASPEDRSSSCRKAQLIFPWRTTSSRGSSTRPSGLLWILCKAQASQVTCNFGVGLCDTAHQASSGLYGHSSLQELIKHLVKKSPLKPNCFKIFNFSSWADLEVFFFPSPLHFPKMRQLK